MKFQGEIDFQSASKNYFVFISNLKEKVEFCVSSAKEMYKNEHGHFYNETITKIKD